MDITTFSEQLQTRMKEKLGELNTDQDELLKLGNALTFIRTIIGELKGFVSKYKFESEDEEIKFFKEIKPVFLSQFYYYKKVFSLRLFDSFKDIKSRQANYYKMLQQLEKYARKNHEFYEYCMTNSTFLDRHYFLRNNQTHKLIDRDEKFSTGHENKLARILANELVKKNILKLLENSGDETPALTWTGSKTDLIELMYALQSVHAFNNGSADLKQIASSFERYFNIGLGNYSRVLQDIRLRKSGQTNFLDELTDKLQQKLSQFD